MKQMINKYKFTEMVHDKVRGTCSRESVYWTTKAVFECMSEILEAGDKLFIKEYFTLYPQLKKERTVSNFGNPCVCPEHYVPCFKPGKNLKEACNYFKEHEGEEVEDEDCGD